MTDRDKLIEYIHEGFRISAWHHTNYAEEIADNLLANDVALVRHGEWEWFAHGSDARTCSNCHISQTVNIYNDKVMYNYCPYCGTKMDGGKRE